MGSERVKGYATKTNWKRRCSPQGTHPRVIFRNFSVKVVARILRRILVTLYIYIKKKAFKINAKIEDVGLNED